MSAPSAVSGQRAGRMTMNELRLVKKVDKASTSLMTVMSTNELMPTAILTVRKSGGTASLPYFVIKLEQARINSYNVNSVLTEDGTPALMEHLALSFKTINVDYTMQSGTGGGTGTSNFQGAAAPEN